MFPLAVARSASSTLVALRQLTLARDSDLALTTHHFQTSFNSFVANHSHRLELLEFLAQGERSVEDLADRAGLSVANTSQHLLRLRRSGLAASRKRGQQVLYRLADGRVVELLSIMRSLAEANLAELERLLESFLHGLDDLEPAPASEILRRMQNGEVTVLDVRPADEFAAGHLPGAVNIPLKDLERSLNRLPANREVIAYCRGPYCVLAFQAVARLREKGLTVRRLADGFPEWKQAGFPVETGPVEMGAGVS